MRGAKQVRTTTRPPQLPEVNAVIGQREPGWAGGSAAADGICTQRFGPRIRIIVSILLRISLRLHSHFVKASLRISPYSPNLGYEKEQCCAVRHNGTAKSLVVSVLRHRFRDRSQQPDGRHCSIVAASCSTEGGPSATNSRSIAKTAKNHCNGRMKHPLWEQR